MIIGEKEYRKKQNIKTIIALLICMTLLIGFYMILHSFTKNDYGNRLLQHCRSDSFTLQAMQWRKGKIKLDHDYPWLELAIYNDDYYVSFPQFPVVPLYILTFFFGENTPNYILVMVYNILAFLFAFLCCRRMGSSILNSILGACFTCIASACLFLSMSGGVWFIAQLLAILLTLASFYFILSDKKLDWYIAMFLLALAVGCRPFQAIYFLFFIYLLFKRHNFKIHKTWSYFIAPFVVAITYMAYNYVRFKNIFEFGHNYLPEFTRIEPDNFGQFSRKYIAGRFEEFFCRHPVLTKEGLVYNQFGFTFYISNVIFILMLVAILIYLYKLFKAKTIDKESNGIQILLLAVLVSIHVILFLFHKTAGGWQFGARYMADAIPGALICILYCKNVLYKKTYVPVMVLLSFGMALNILGALKMGI